MGFWAVLSFVVEKGYLLVLLLSENDGYEIKEPPWQWVGHGAISDVCTRLVKTRIIFCHVYLVWP
jgi:hypothetical protein